MKLFDKYQFFISLIAFLGIFISNSFAQNVGVNTTGAAPAATNLFEVLQPSTTANSVGVYSRHLGNPGSGTAYAFQAIANGAGVNNVAAYLSATGASGTNYSLIVPSGGGNVGIGTTSPNRLFTLSGTASSLAGPHIEAYTNADASNPVFQLLNWTSDNVSLNFGSFYNGAWTSSDAGSSFQIYKLSDIFRIRYGVAAAGAAVTWNEGISMNTSGAVSIGNGSFYGDSRFSIAGTNGNNDAALTTAKEDGTTNPIFSILPWDNQIYISAGIYYTDATWTHSSSGTTNQLFVMTPGSGTSWYASNNSAGSWNVSSNRVLWDDNSYWKSLVQSTATGDSYFTGGNLGVGTPSPSQSIHSTGNIRFDGRYAYFGASQYLYGDKSSALYWNGIHSTVTQMIFRYTESTQYGRVYGSGDGANFGLLDGDGNWSYLAVKDSYTAFRINDVEKARVITTGFDVTGKITTNGVNETYDIRLH